MEDGSKVFEAGGGSGSGEAPPQPFYESLARRLELLQTQGALGVAQVGPAATRNGLTVPAED